MSSRQLDIGTSSWRERCGLEITCNVGRPGQVNGIESYEQTSSVMILGISFSLSKPYRIVIPSWIMYRCPYFWARPPVMSDGELPSFSFLVSAVFSCNLDPSPVGVGKPEARCLPASSMTSFKPYFHSSAFFSIQTVQITIPFQGPV